MKNLLRVISCDSAHAGTMLPPVLFLLCALFFPGITYAANPMAHLDPISSVLFWIASIFLCGLMGRYAARRFNQPAVLGELLMGVLVGNICYFFLLPQMIVLREGSAVFGIVHDVLMGVSLSDAVSAALPGSVDVAHVVRALEAQQGFEWVQVAHALDIFSRYGVIFLLFMVGLECSIEDIRSTGRESLKVAVIGVFFPMLLGFLVVTWLIPEAGFHSNLFIAATLSATSVGITARVIKEIHKMQTHEAKTILGAAVIDDILGLVILAIVSSLVVIGRVDSLAIAEVVFFAAAYFVAVIFCGPWILKRMVKALYFLEPWEIKLVTSFLFLMVLCWMATWVQLASIIGAFAAGVMLHDGYFERPGSTAPQRTIYELISPLESLFAPLFFTLIGIQVKLETFLDWHVLMIALGLIVAAIVGKLMSGLGADSKHDRLLVGVGMLPRGEVGLVFASIGRTLGVISDQLFAAIILMVIVTTCVAPPWIKSRFQKRSKAQHAHD